jgi:exosortase E/protease (VPEID-CTERM system)
LVIGFAALFLAVAYLKNKPALEQLSGQAASVPVRWGLAAGHVGAMAVFAILSAGLYGHRMPGLPPDFLAAGWMAAGSAGIAFAALAVLPRALWAQLVRHTDFAWAYAATAVLLAASAENASRALWRPAATLTFRLVKMILQPFVTVITADASARLIQTTHFRVRIAPECSGLEGAGLMLAFGATLLWVLRDECRFPQCLVLLPGGVSVLFLLNTVRIAALVLIGDAGARQIAAGGFHSQAGWIAFNSVAFGLAFAVRSMPWFSIRRPATEESEKWAENPTAAYLMPFLAVLAAGMLSRAVTGDFEWAYPVRFAAAAVTLWIFRGTYEDMDWKFGWVAIAAGTCVFGFWVALDRLLGAGAVAMPSALAASPPTLRVSWIAIRILAAVATVPVAEELAFRGFLLRRLISADFEAVPMRSLHWIALLGSSAAFGALHGGRWFAGTVAGVSYGVVLSRSGRMGDAVAAHATTNALLAAYVLFFQQWQFW